MRRASAALQAQARLGQDVLAGLQRGQRDRAVQIRPGADDDGVDVRVGDEVFPALGGARDVESRAAAAVDSGRRLQTATISTSGKARRPGMCRDACWRRRRSGRREGGSARCDCLRRLV